LRFVAARGQRSDSASDGDVQYNKDIRELIRIGTGPWHRIDDGRPLCAAAAQWTYVEQRGGSDHRRFSLTRSPFHGRNPARRYI
jgi:hypothetical protein